MNNYIQEFIRNKTKKVTKDLSRPQEKAVKEIMRGLFVQNTPILRHLAQSENKLVKKQAEKYSYHLGNIDIVAKVNKISFQEAKKDVRQRTIIAYDLTDISKETSSKIEKLSRVFDGSKRKVTNGYLLHGVGINNILVRLEFHDGERKAVGQIRQKIIEEIAPKLERKGIWIFDRGNDDKQFFQYLSKEIKVDFIARLKENRQVVLKKNGDKVKIRDLKPGKYRVYLMKRYNRKVDKEVEYTLVIQHHLNNHEPIRLLSNLKYERYSKRQLVQMYLERWGIENIFKRIKTKFNLEKIRVLSYQKFTNLVALIQLASVITTSMYKKIHESTTMVIAGLLAVYKKFVYRKTLTISIESFISFIRTSLKPFVFRKFSPLKQLSLFSRRRLEKLGSF